nr:MAG TPA: hypothetical protein [Caudoviricetes sp.]
MPFLRFPHPTVSPSSKLPLALPSLLRIKFIIECLFVYRVYNTLYVQ